MPATPDARPREPRLAPAGLAEAPRGPPPRPGGAVRNPPNEALRPAATRDLFSKNAVGARARSGSSENEGVSARADTPVFAKEAVARAARAAISRKKQKWHVPARARRKKAGSCQLRQPTIGGKKSSAGGGGEGREPNWRMRHQRARPLPPKKPLRGWPAGRKSGRRARNHPRGTFHAAKGLADFGEADFRDAIVSEIPARPVFAVVEARRGVQRRRSGRNEAEILRRSPFCSASGPRRKGRRRRRPRKAAGSHPRGTFHLQHGLADFRETGVALKMRREISGVPVSRCKKASRISAAPKAP
jgi:hypothetical protein